MYGNPRTHWLTSNCHVEAVGNPRNSLLVVLTRKSCDGNPSNNKNFQKIESMSRKSSYVYVTLVAWLLSFGIKHIAQEPVMCMLL